MAVVLSPEAFRRLSEAASGRVTPAVQRLRAESAKRWAKVYEALAGSLILRVLRVSGKD